MKIALLVLGYASFLLYFPMEARKTKSHFLKTALDDKIPFLPIFVIPYLLFFPYLFGSFAYAYFAPPFLFYRFAISLIAVSIATAIIYLTYPSMMIRPFTGGGLRPDSLFDRIVKAIEKFDRPNNIFPSNHVAYSLVVTLSLYSIYPTLGWLFWVLFAFISASTILIKQHNLIDIPAGVLVALLSWWLSGIIV